jgi:hypothetical protein
MKHQVTCFLLGAVPSVGAMASGPSPRLGGSTAPTLGTFGTPALGLDMALPVMSVIAAIGLVAGIRYIRNKRS